MISRITYSLLVFFLICFGSAAFAQLDSLYTQQWNRDPILNLNATTSAQRQIITAEQIRVSGYTRLSDLFNLIDGWTIKPPEISDGYPELQSNGTGNYNHQNWVLMLNGQRLEMDRDPVLYVNQLAIPVYDIERIEIVNSGGMYLGEFSQNGLINIITQKSGKDKINIGTMISSRFNLDGGSNDIVSSLGYNKNKFHLNTTLAFTSFSYSADNYGSSGLATSIEIQYIGKKISHQIQTKSLGENRTTNYHLISYLTQWNLNDRNEIMLSSTINFNTISFSTAIHFANNLQHRYLNPHKKGNFIWQNGICYDYINYLSNSSIGPDYYVPILKPYSSINIPLTRKSNLFSDVQAAFAHDKIAPKISFGIYKKVSVISNYSFVVAYTEMLLEESFLTKVNQEINAIGGATNYNNPKLATADFYYNMNIGSSFKFSYNSGLKKSFDLPDYQYTITDTFLFSTTGYNVIQQIQPTYQFNWINRFNIHYDIIKNTLLDINYLNTQIVNSWDENLRNIPKHKFTLIVKYDFKHKFTLWSRNYLQSKTVWLDPHMNSEPEGPVLYSTNPMLFSWELGLSKKLLKDHVNINLTTRNFFGKSLNYYSSGNNNYQGMVSISITANIDGIGKPKGPNP